MIVSSTRRNINSSNMVNLMMFMFIPMDRWSKMNDMVSILVTQLASVRHSDVVIIVY